MDNMKDWIKKINNSELSSLSKQFDTELIKPLDKTKQNIKKGIEQAHIVNDEGKKFFPFPKQLVYRVTYGVAACFIIAVSAIVFSLVFRPGPVYTSVTLAHGRPLVIAGNNTTAFSAGMQVKEGTAIVTKKEENTGIQVMDYALAKISQESRVEFTTLRKNKLAISLEQGELLVKTHKPASHQVCEVRTHNTVIRFGSILLIRYNRNTTYVALLKGSAEIRQIDRTDSDYISHQKDQ